MATKAGTLRRAGDGRPATATAVAARRATARSRIAAALASSLGRYRELRGLEGARERAEVGRATGARC